jgi:hypothetical protein
MLTLVWFLASMGPDMNSKSAPLNEALAAARSHTRVRPLIGVDTIMPLEVRLAVKTLGYSISGPVNNIASKCFRTLLHVCQSHWKGRAFGSFSTSSMTSILRSLLSSNRIGHDCLFSAESVLSGYEILRVGLERMG